MMFIYIFISVLISVYGPIGAIFYYARKREKEMEDFEERPVELLARVMMIEDVEKKKAATTAIFNAIMEGKETSLDKYSKRVDELLAQQKEKKVDA